jgi:hypothetical protein
MSSVGGPYDNTNAGVPASVPASAGGVDVAALLAQTTAQSEQYQKALTAAQVPVAQRTTPGLPSTMTRPIGPAPQTQGYAQPRSKGQAIANMITNAGNAVSQVVTAEKQQKQSEHVDMATKFLTAQQALSEAQQQHDAATASGNQEAASAAQKSIDQNKSVIDTTLADKKKRGILAKGLNINYIDPSENKTDEHTAVQAALKNVQGFQAKRAAAEEAKKEYQATANKQGAQNFGTAFAAAQPQGMAVNKPAQQQFAALQAQRQQQFELYKSVLPKEIEAKGQMARTLVENRTKLDVQNARDLQADKDNRSAQLIAEYSRRTQLAIAQLNANKADQANQLKAVELFQNAGKLYQEAAGEKQKQWQALSTELDKSSDSSRRLEIRRQMLKLETDTDLLKKDYDGQLKMVAAGSGLKVDDVKLQVPTVHVGDGATDGGNAGAGHSANQPDLDPTTGKPWKSGTPTYDKLFIKGVAEAGTLINEGKRALDSANSSYRKLQRELDPDKNTTD